MKGLKLFEKMNGIDDQFIEEASREKFYKKRKNVWHWILPAAAGVVIAFGILSQLKTVDPIMNPTKQKDHLPILTIDFTNGGMGFEGLMAYKVDEIIDENPWDPNVDISTLPVYKNPSYIEKEEKQSEKLVQLMMKKAEGVAKLFGIENAEVQVKPSDEDIKSIEEKYAAIGKEVPEEMYEIEQVYIQQDSITIETDRTLLTTIKFHPEIELPEEFHFYYDASYDELYKVAQFFIDEYQYVFQMKKPTINIHGGDYSIDGDQLFRISIFDREGTIEEQLINYHFHSVSFHNDEEGNLSFIRINQPDLSNEVGNYPIVTVDEAKKRLENGHYLTTVPEPLPGMEYVKKVKLVYRKGLEKYWMPYYQFFVELPSMKNANGLKTYGVYYVPAIEEQYLDYLPVWNEAFYS
ncbi:hypothetical protein [Fervidibacillus halotolerans]|uniref:Uncharacterized protein n=1 Tax=Fervidibacillus halotolerans TaxID=2980027 RepID=A0A9E8LXF5_9BACI|nr:hypothetical protein [Fervidibacillus halotolerans]WAA11457.1 hypothetical protein OE105_07370 [Fervidibacillus halotolerans]